MKVHNTIGIVFLVTVWPALLFGQPIQRKVVSGSITYVTPALVYLNVGRQDSVAVGDTMTVIRGNQSIGTVAVTAVSKKNSAAQVSHQAMTLAVGDIVRIEKEIQLPLPSDAAVHANAATPVTPATLPIVIDRHDKSENIVSGRVGIQYSGVLASDARFDLSQPSSTLRLEIRNLYSTGLHFTMYGRTYYDLSPSYNRYGETSRLKNRVYEMQLRNESPDAAVQYGVGRMSSAYVGGLGTFDGGFVYHRYDNITTGVLLGAKVQDRTLAVDGDDKKGALFLNAKFGDDDLHQYDGTVAYGKELIESKLDREFIYLQNHVMLGPEFSLYESTEFELNEINKGIRRKAFSLSNTYVSVNYVPYTWMTTNIGYDGTRTIYLFESMKSISDTMIDKHLMHGYRAGVTFRLPYFMSVSGTVAYRTRQGESRAARTFSGTYRFSDIAGSDIGASLRYADIIGVYSDGKNFTADLDRMFFQSLSLALRYDYYRYQLLAIRKIFVTQTITLSANYRISRVIYSAMNLDKVYDASMNSVRVYAEIGVRF